MAIGLALDRGYAPMPFTRSTSNLGDRLVILAANLAPCVTLGLMAHLGLRVLVPRLRFRPLARLGVSLLIVGLAAAGSVRRMPLVMRAVVGLAQ